MQIGSSVFELMTKMLMTDGRITVYHNTCPKPCKQAYKCEELILKIIRLTYMREEMPFTVRCQTAKHELFTSDFNVCLSGCSSFCNSLYFCDKTAVSTSKLSPKLIISK